MYCNTAPLKTLSRLKITLCLILFFLQSSLANDAKYIIDNIIINEEAESASEARKLANINANRQAFLKLLKNLRISESFSNYIDDEQLDEAIDAKKITNEKIANNWYKANFQIEFSKNYIDNLLEDWEKGSGINLESDKKYLIFPIEIHHNKPRIWHDNNKWFNAWRSALSDLETNDIQYPIKIPKGDLDDIALLNLQNIDKIKYPDIKDILKKYDSKIGTFIDIYIDHLENNAAINITLIQQFTKKKVKLSFVNINDLKEERLYYIITEKVIEYLKKKDLSTINNKKEDENDNKNINLDILPSSLKDWVIFKHRLSKIPDINFEVNSISSDVIKLTIIPKKELDIIKYLADHDIVVTKNKNNEKIYYIILE
jgi:hypothetical protein